MYIYMSFLYVCICINMYKQLNNKCVATTHPVHKTFWDLIIWHSEESKQHIMSGSNM